MIDNNIMTGINIVCTGASFLGAAKSVLYYKKSKTISIYTNTNSAYLEIKNILNTFNEILSLVSIPQGKGKNKKIEIQKKYMFIKEKMDIIRDNLTAKDNKILNELLNSNKFNLDKYLDSFIVNSNSIDIDNIINDDFYKCQKVFREIQLLMKSNLEKLSEKLK